jgi:hypothetical protein
MDVPVAFPAKGDEILFGIAAELTSGRDVVNFKVARREA